MTTNYDHGARLNTQAGALETSCIARYDELQEKLAEFHAKGFLWVGPKIRDCIGWDEAQEAVYAGEQYCEWFQRKKLCRTAREVETVQAEYSALFNRWVNEEIETIARRSLAWDQKAHQEDAA